ncbi:MULTISPECIES: hypothetical protein [unclassified Streptomyces]|uniref:hypothetical protein n=1 Tax=unclassified Streptomyces TaxID=2593676 RepID=UPI00352F96F6
MPDPTLAARSLSQAIDSAESRQISEAGRDFIEKLTFATADEILTMLRELLAEDWMALPPWARNLAYRLACLQRPDDPPLLREAAADLLCFGPDWDAFAEDLKRRAAELEQGLHSAEVLCRTTGPAWGRQMGGKALRSYDPSPPQMNG